MTAVSVQQLSKRYGQIEALRGIDLSVPEGVIFGLVGPNGSGKSTLIKALVGSLRPSAGDVKVLGLDPLRDSDALRRKIGYMPQEAALYRDLSARDNIAFFAAAHRTADLSQRIEEILTFTELQDRADDPIGQFSGGMQRRVSLACALVHRPDILFLDEPTAAVDPALRARFWHTFRALAADGVTLFVSTHLMDEALLCDLVAVLRLGRILTCAPPRQILAHGHTTLRLGSPDGERALTIGSRPEDLAAALHPFGLQAAIGTLSVEQGTLESVVLEMIGTDRVEA